MTLKEVYELDVYQLAEELSDLIWNAYDQWSPKVQNTLGYQIIRASDSIAAHSGFMPFGSLSSLIAYSLQRNTRA